MLSDKSVAKEAGVLFDAMARETIQGSVQTYAFSFISEWIFGIFRLCFSRKCPPGRLVFAKSYVSWYLRDIISMAITESEKWPNVLKIREVVGIV